MDIRTVKITCIHRNRRYHIKVGDKNYNQHSLARVMGRDPRSIERSFRHMKKIGKNPVDWIREILWKKEHNLSLYSMIYKKAHAWWTVEQLMEKCNLSKSAAYERLRGWDRGYVSDEQLVEPASERHKRIMADKDMTRVVVKDPRSSKVRRKNLEAIPGPTDIERELWGY